MSIFSDNEVGRAKFSPKVVASGWTSGDWTMKYNGCRRLREAIA